jgi:hypothetical protein
MGLMIVGMVVGAYAMQGAKPASDPAASSYLSVNEESFPTVLARMRAGKADIEKRLWRRFIHTVNFVAVGWPGLSPQP